MGGETQRAPPSGCRFHSLGPCWFDLSLRASRGEDDADGDLTAENQVTDVDINSKAAVAGRWKKHSMESRADAG